MRLIDADLLKATIKAVCCHSEDESDLLDAVEQIPSVDAVEQKHGKWIPFQRPNGGYYKGCSICSFPMPTDSMCDFMDETDNRFCYNCGASMDGKEQNDEID